MRLWVGTTASGLATWALPFVLGLAIVDGTLSAGALGLALAARTVGFLAALPLAGVLADRVSPRFVVLVAGAIAAVAGLLLAWGLGRSVSVLVAASVVVGIGQGACRPAFQALVPAVVPRDRLRQANAAITIAVRSTVLAGPTVAAAASTVIGPAWLVVATSLLWAVAALVPGRPARPSTTPKPSSSLVAEFSEGWREAGRHPWFIAGLGALGTVIMTGYSVTAVAVPIVSRESGSGFLLAATATGYTVGALLGALLIVRWKPADEGWVALGALATYALAPITLALDSPAAVIVGAYVLVGVAIELFNVPWFTAAQREIPADRLSRVSSIDLLVSYGLAPLGLALIAPAIERFGLDPVLWVCAVACLAAPLLAALVPSSRRFTRHAA